MMFAENDRLLSRVTPSLFVLSEGDNSGVVNRDGEVLDWAGLPREEEQLRLVEVELEVVGPTSKGRYLTGMRSCTSQHGYQKGGRREK